MMMVGSVTYASAENDSNISPDQLKLTEANPASGGLRFELPEGKCGASPRPGAPRRDRTLARGPRRGRPANIRHQGRKR